MVNLAVWLGIIFCISQSAMFSGLNLACFTISKLKLEIEAKEGDKHAKRVLKLREDSNFLLATILWGNVAVNVLLALLSGSVLAGVSAFIFSTVIITIFGEIIPQAYFSRNAIRFASVFYPVIRFYQILFYPVSKTTGLLLDKLVGKEAILYFKERNLTEMIKMHMASMNTDITNVEGQGAINFLEIDDVPLRLEGEEVDPRSIIQLPFVNGVPQFPEIKPEVSDEFIQKINASGKNWIVITGEDNEPRMVIDSDALIRDALFYTDGFTPLKHCHHPIIVKNKGTTIGYVLSSFKVDPEHSQDDIVDYDVILLWGEEKRIITGTDILGRLLRGIVRNPSEEIKKGRK